MKITILGSGSAYGTPMIFNNWGIADSNTTRNLRTRASILLEENGKSILIDAGPDLRAQINENNISNIDSVFLTHGHYDHIAGVPELPRACKLLGHGIHIWASAETTEELHNCYGYLFKSNTDAEPNSRDLMWHTLPDNGTFNAEDLTFRTIGFPHHKLHSSAFRYKNFAYVTDWQKLPEDIGDFLQDLDLLIIECNNGISEETNGHSNLNNIQKVISQYSPKKVVLSHLSTRVDYHEFSKILPENCLLSYDGMILEI